MKSLIAVVLGACAVLLVGSCVSDDSPPAAAPMIPAAAGLMTAPQAASAIAEARCNRAARCGQIGPIRPYATRDHCLSVMRGEAQQALSSCQYGAKEREVLACSIELERQICDSVLSPFGWLPPAMLCDPGRLCLR